MTTFTKSVGSTRPATERILAQGTIEKALPDELACTQRVLFSKADVGRAPADGGRALKLGIGAGAFVEWQFYDFVSGKGFRVDHGAVADEIIARQRPSPADAAIYAELRPRIIELGRDWMGRVPPPDDPDLDLAQAEPVLPPQSDLFVRRPDVFVIRARPDLVVAVGSTLVAMEFSTAKDPTSISPARYALNYFALLRERLRRKDWGQYQGSVTRVEMLSLGYGFTVRLQPHEAEEWRTRIGAVATALLEERYEREIGPHCSACFYQPTCWLGGEEDPGQAF